MPERTEPLVVRGEVEAPGALAERLTVAQARAVVEAVATTPSVALEVRVARVGLGVLVTLSSVHTLGWWEPSAAWMLGLPGSLTASR